MDYIDEIIVKTNTARNNTQSLVDAMVQLNFPNIQADILRRWSFGKSVDGGIIGVYSWGEYEVFKKEINPLAGGNVDLTLTGALGEGLIITKKGGLFEITSTDWKFEKIAKQYGLKEFNITDEEKYVFFEQLTEFVLETQIKNIYS